MMTVLARMNRNPAEMGGKGCVPDTGLGCAVKNDFELRANCDKALVMIKDGVTVSPFQSRPEYSLIHYRSTDSELTMGTGSTRCKEVVDRVVI